jgi:hypothetical protein
MSTPGLPNFPSKRSINAKIRAYSIAAHQRGAHAQEPKPTCPLCTSP